MRKEHGPRSVARVGTIKGSTEANPFTPKPASASSPTTDVEGLDEQYWENPDCLAGTDEKPD